MIALVCGGRSFEDRALLYARLDYYNAALSITKIIHGGARGADTLAGEWAADRGIAVQVFPADWESPLASRPDSSAINR